MGNSPARSPIDVGSVIAGTYTIEALIGRGGMGAVFLASHNRLPGKQVAIKVLHTDSDDEEILIRFRREAEIASRLGHPNIVGVSDFNISEEGMPYLVLEYLAGESLAQRIKRGPMPVEQVLPIIRQVSSALAAAHREGIVHRDLKPQNIFLCPTEVDGRTVEVAKVLDFGISKIRGSQTVKTQDNSLLGTPQYMAPEQATGQHTAVDERTDIFALGAIVYEMLVGHPAFSGASIPEVVFKVVYEEPKPLSEVAPGTPASVVAAVQKAMAKPADQRFPTVNAFVEGLTGEPLSAFRSHSSIPVPDTGFASGSRHSKTGPKLPDDAFANTVGSGDHGPAPVPPPTADKTANTVSSLPLGTDATVAPTTGRSIGDAIGSGSDATIAPSSGRASIPRIETSGSTLAGVGTAAKAPAEPGTSSTTSTPVTAEEPTRQPGRPHALIAALAVAVIAAIVVVVVVTRGGSHATTPAHDAAQVATAELHDAATPAVAVDAVVVDAAIPATTSDAAVVAPVVDAGPRPTPRDAAARVVPPVDAKPAVASNPAITALLDEAQANLDGGAYLAAAAIAKQAMVTEGATRTDRERGTRISAIAYCKAHHHEEAKNMYRQAPPGFQKAIKSACKNVDFDTQ